MPREHLACKVLLNYVTSVYVVTSPCIPCGRRFQQWEASQVYSLQKTLPFSKHPD